ncbi:MAG: hypothetical protein WBV59_04620 [Anaerolineae bacterium]
MITIPDSALHFGFDNGPGGPHASRTMMLSELRALLDACPPSAAYKQYSAAVVAQNVLLKRTETTRRESLRRLRELYGLSRSTVIFRALRDLWDEAPAEQPSLALLAALARDPLLRATAKPVIDARPGDPVSAGMLAEAVTEQFSDRLNPMSRASISRHAASTWTQAGHLQGRSHKVRAALARGPAAVTYALFLGYLCGARGAALFETFWARITDAATAELHEQAFVAARLGWLEYRRVGDVTEVRFSYLLRGEEGATGE